MRQGKGVGWKNSKIMSKVLFFGGVGGGRREEIGGREC